jgi:hypothetical protein
MNDMKQKLLRFASVAAMIVALHAAEYQGHYRMFGGGGSSSGTTTENSVTQPWSGQEPYLSQQYQTAQALYNNPADYPQLYPGTTTGSQVAPMNSTETQAITDAGNASAGNSALQSAGNTLQNYNSGAMLSAQNPYFQQMAQTVAAQDQPALTQSFNAGNDMNNPGAAFAVSQGLNNAIGNLAYQNYNTQSTNQLTSAADSAQNNNSQVVSNQNALTAGQAGQTQAQNVLGSQIQGYNYNQQLPYSMLNQYIQETMGNPGSSTSTTSPYFSNTASNLLGAGSSIGGSALSAYMLSSMMQSDRRLKKNIVRIGETAKKIPLYVFEYIWSDKKHVGVMSDEVRKIVPEAVHTGMFGFDMVDYSMVGV